MAKEHTSKKNEASTEHLQTRQWVKITLTGPCARKTKIPPSARNQETIAYPETPSSRNESAHLI
jgi:hypothetical protein